MTTNDHILVINFYISAKTDRTTSVLAGKIVIPAIYRQKVIYTHTDKPTTFFIVVGYNTQIIAVGRRRGSDDTVVVT